MAELKYWVWLSSVAGMGPGNVRRLLERFESPDQVFFAQREEFEALGWLSAGAINALCAKKLYQAVEIIDRCAAHGWQILTVRDAAYPERLRNIYDPPVVLYVRGGLPYLDGEAVVGVVGTRNCTPYGLKAAERMGYELAKSGCVVTTGLARGIDTAAAKGALRGGGKVIGVLGCGLDVVYPAENDRLYDDVAAVGALITEYPPGTEPSGRHFPARNRIISGIALGITVIEAPEKSGSIITANHALEQGRDVFVVPGNIDSPASAGSNALLREGAIAVMSGYDIAREYEAGFDRRINVTDRGTDVPVEPAETVSPFPAAQVEKQTEERKPDAQAQPAQEPVDLSPEEQAVYDVLAGGKLHVDEIMARCGVEPGAALSALTMLEISGVIRQEPGKFFSRL